MKASHSQSSKATDPDGDALTLTASGLPAFASLTDNGDGSGRLILSPDFTHAGTFSARLTATDAGTPPLSTARTSASSSSTSADRRNWPPGSPGGRRGPDRRRQPITSRRSRWRRPDAHGQWPAGLCQLHGYRQWHGQRNPDAGL